MVAGREIQEHAAGRPLMRRRRRRAATILLLLLESLGLLAFIAVAASWVDREQETVNGLTSTMATNWIFIATTGLPVAVLSLLAAAALLARFGPGWLLGMLAQGVLLLNCLLNYIGNRSGWVYPLMVVGMAYVFFLNSYAVRTALEPEPVPKPAGSSDGG